MNSTESMPKRRTEKLIDQLIMEAKSSVSVYVTTVRAINNLRGAMTFAGYLRHIFEETDLVQEYSEKIKGHILTRDEVLTDPINGPETFDLYLASKKESVTTLAVEYKRIKKLLKRIESDYEGIIFDVSHPRFTASDKLGQYFYTRVRRVDTFAEDYVPPRPGRPPRKY